MCCSQEEQSDADSPLDGLDSGFTGRAADLEPASDEAAGVATPPPECVAPPPIVAHDGGGSDGSIGPFILIRVPGPTDQTGDAALFPHPDLTAQRRRRAMLPLTLTAALYGPAAIQRRRLPARLYRAIGECGILAHRSDAP